MAKQAQKKKAQEKKVVPPLPESSSSELDEDDAENSQPLANSTTRGTPVALNKTVKVHKIPNLAEEESDEETESESEEEEEQSELEVRNGANPKKRKTVRSRSKRAGLIFPVGRIHRQLKQGGYADRIGESASVYMAGVLEYLVCEMAETSGDVARSNRKVRITPRHIQLAVRNDLEFDELLGEVIIPSSGVRPHVNSALLPKPTEKKKVKEAPTAANEPGISGSSGTTNGAGTSKQASKKKETAKIVLTGGKKRKNQNETDAAKPKARKGASSK